MDIYAGLFGLLIPNMAGGNECPLSGLIHGNSASKQYPWAPAWMPNWVDEWEVMHPEGRSLTQLSLENDRPNLAGDDTTFNLSHARLPSTS